MARDKFYNKFKETKNLDETTLGEVEELARGMELNEISDYFGFDLAEEVQDESGKLNENAYGGFVSDELSPDEIKWVLKSFKRGRATGIKTAVDKLFTSMGDRNGQNASLPYLRRFAKEWPDDGQIKEGDFLFFRANK